MLSMSSSAFPCACVNVAFDVGGRRDVYFGCGGGQGSTRGQGNDGVPCKRCASTGYNSGIRSTLLGDPVARLGVLDKMSKWEDYCNQSREFITHEIGSNMESVKTARSVAISTTDIR